ncbi:AGL306Cp [Eremothecium gossypii ATCC 10895]|uniref:Bud site selection protein 4 homolog n=1 Tax=Eremothecium gossypii (strain ATCC 10895 / CBS 109.51 / FGSC 9923 / NRRL Y-1056) TaxID=284811 RepID=BUD4_EREGS|nr:AGL306Cp [Eremothecium gossypii ATCC 10895]Q751K7.1 RecName: Full=Bud site selection protein 4 homolog [Eremothecium gossypii ATCC 10895]AAS54185.1 AGL306Cp [Eremothecium gossypii ATCC 10895]
MDEQSSGQDVDQSLDTLLKEIDLKMQLRDGEEGRRASAQSEGSLRLPAVRMLERGMVASASHKSVTFDEEPPSVHEYSVVMDSSAGTSECAEEEREGADGYECAADTMRVLYDEDTDSSCMGSERALAGPAAEGIVPEGYKEADLLGTERAGSGTPSLSYDDAAGLGSPPHVIFTIKPTSPLNAYDRGSWEPLQSNTAMDTPPRGGTAVSQHGLFAKAPKLPAIPSPNSRRRVSYAGSDSYPSDDSATDKRSLTDKTVPDNRGENERGGFGYENSDRNPSIETGTTDEYQSAGEYKSMSSSEANDDSKTEASVEDLRISNKPQRDTTIQDLHATTLPRSSSTLIPPALPPLDPSFFGRLARSPSYSPIRDRGSSEGSVGEHDSSLEQDHELGMGQQSARTNSSASGNSSDSVMVKPLSLFSNSQVDSLHLGAPAPDNSTPNKEALPSACPPDAMKSIGTQTSILEDKAESGPSQSSATSEKSVMLPNFPRFESFFDDSYPFGHDSDRSNNSVSYSKRTLKPSNYLSIWHLQEAQMRHDSPAFSANSQFSCKMVGESKRTSLESSRLSAKYESRFKFKFKPKLVSRRRIYYNKDQWRNFQEPPTRYYSNCTESDHISSDVPGTPVSPSIKSRNLCHGRTRGNMKMVERVNSLCSANERLSSAGNGDETFLSASSNLDVTSRRPSVDIISEISTKDLLPKIKQDSDGFNELIKTFVDHDEQSQQTDSTIASYRRGTRDTTIYHIWEHSIQENSISDYGNSPTAGKGTISKLLDNHEVEFDGKNSFVTGLGIIKKTDQDSRVDVLRIDSTQGIEAIQSFSPYSYRNAFDPVTPTKSAYHGCEALQASQMGTPFRPAISTTLQAQSGLGHKRPAVERPTTAQLGNYVSAEMSPEVQEPAEETKKRTDLQDNGQLYFVFVGIEQLALRDIERHSAECSIEFDNGNNVVQSEWLPLPKSGSMSLNQEYSVIIAEESLPNMIITLKCRYKSPKKELVEITEKVPLKSKCCGLGKPKYKQVKKLLRREMDFDEWDYKIAQDGSFARCKEQIDEELLKNVRYKKQQFRWTLLSEWERDHSKEHKRKRAWELPRLPAHPAGALVVDMCYLPRTSRFEKFPKTLQIARRVVNKFKEQKAIAMEGFMWQEGGDTEVLKRRYFTLNGTQLVAHHEITKKPKAMINLLRVEKLLTEAEISREMLSSSSRCFTDLVLLHECFVLFFENGEEIMFNPDTKTEKLEWIEKLRKVIELNRFHQPWVKKFLNSSENIL